MQSTLSQQREITENGPSIFSTQVCYLTLSPKQEGQNNIPYHHPVLRMDHVDRPLCFLLYRRVDDSACDSINQIYSNESALMMCICALCHHSKQVWIQGLQQQEKKKQKTSETLPFSATGNMLICISSRTSHTKQSILLAQILWRNQQ